ncbi:hypothetical protein [Natronomonas sp. EA1]|uniref:hypothetical protein n=1 Tax=Natronomonas sp. EA1 TaxID=3421655 RepID=UPI003EB88AAC
MSYRKRPTGGSRRGPVATLVGVWHSATERLHRFSLRWSRRYIEMQARAFEEP